MSIAPPVGAMSAYLSKLISSKPYRSLRHVLAEVSRNFRAASAWRRGAPSTRAGW